MTIGFTLNVLGWQLGTLGVRIDLDESPGYPPLPGLPVPRWRQFARRAVKATTNVWTGEMTA